MRLEDLHPNPGARHRPKRKGRGIGSGHGKTSCRGSKGQASRDTIPSHFEGGQTPLHRRVPRFRGFRNRFQQTFSTINVGALACFPTGTEVTPELLMENGLVRELRDGIKILGDGEIGHALSVRAHRFSEGARTKLIEAGGTAEVIEG